MNSYAVEVGLSTGDWHTTKIFVQTEFALAHKIVLDIASFGIHARILGEQVLSFCGGQIKAQDISILEELLKKRARLEDEKLKN